jgi:sialate O-acetylesterase
VWFRRGFSLSAAQAAASASLSIGAIDEVDETWVNGIPIANTFGYGTERTYQLPSGTLRAGENSVVINVLSTWDAGGMYGPPEHLALSFASGDSVPLGHDWQYRVVPVERGLPPRSPWESVAGLSSIYNAMIAPLRDYGLRGVLWYQGESNAGEADRYSALLAALMRDWRDQFRRNLPFLIVQLPNFGAPYVAPAASSWAALREAQRRAVAGDPNAALAVTIDIGEDRELHPPNKQDVGGRLARAARRLIYADPTSPSSPEPRAAHQDGASVVVDFAPGAERFLTYSAGHPIGFELCATEQASCRFAEAIILENRIVISGADFKATRVRYCWGDAPRCNLYGASGLPVGPFEIDIR